MSRINVDKITNATDNGPVELSEGATIPSGKTISCDGNMNVVGSITATSFVGSISDAPSFSKIYALKLIIADPPLRS